MDIIDFTFNGLDGVAIFENQSGYNTVEFEYDEEKESIYVTGNRFTTTLEGDDDLEEEQGSNGISEELEMVYKGNETGLLNKEIQIAMFQLIDAWINENKVEKKEDEICYLCLYKHLKTNAYSVRLSEIDERFELVKCFLSGQRKWIQQFVVPLNSILNLYSTYSSNPVDQVPVRLVHRVIESVFNRIEIFDFDQLIEDEIFERKSQKLIEEASSELLVSAVLTNSVSKIYDGIAKTLLSIDQQEGWLKVKEMRSNRFDFERFKAENPTLYEKYLVETKSIFVVRKKSKGTFPLDEKQMREKIASTFDLILK